MKKASKILVLAMSLVQFGLSAQNVNRGQVGERAANDPSIIDICSCADPAMSSSPNCQAIFASQASEASRAPAGMHEAPAR